MLNLGKWHSEIGIWFIKFYPLSLVQFLNQMPNFTVLLYPNSTYRIAGNFRMVQNFAFFADWSATAKIRTAKL